MKKITFQVELYVDGPNAYTTPKVHPRQINPKLYDERLLLTWTFLM